VLPVIAILAIGVLIYEDIEGLNYSIPNKVLDSIVAGYIALSFFMYRIAPLLKVAWNKLFGSSSQNQQQ
jgi:hypothetical protein